MFNLFSRAKPESEESLAAKVNDLNIRLEVVAEVNKAMVGAIDKQQVFDLITKKLAPLVKMNFPTIWLYDDKTSKISLASHSVPDSIRIIAERALGKPLEKIAFSRENPEERKSTYFKVIDEGQPIFSTDLYKHTYPFLNEQVAKVLQQVSGMRSAVSVPIIVANKTIGVLSAIWQEEKLSKGNEITLFTFANQISSAIYNSQLFSQVQYQVNTLENQNHDLASLYNLTSQISQTLNPDLVSQTAVNSLPQDQYLIGAVVSLLDYSGQKLVPKAVSENSISSQAQGLLGSFSQYFIDLANPFHAASPGYKAVTENRTYYMNDITAALSPPLPKAVIPALAKILDIKSIVVSPLQSRGKPIGTVSYFLRDKPYEQLEPAQQQLFNTYSLQIAIALENAELYSTLQTTLNQLQETRRQERDMLDVMGHELRTPITIVRNGLVMMNKRFKNRAVVPIDEKFFDHYLDVAVESTKREINLIETLLSATKVDASRLQLSSTKVDFVDAVVDAIEGQKYQAELKQVLINFTRSPQPVLVYADRTRTQEIVDNFLSNSVKYTPDTGKIAIHCWQDQEYGWISVADTGMGIAEDDLQNLGKKFFRARQYIPTNSSEQAQMHFVRPGGTGLGLYVAFELIKIMGGKLYINSTVGQGSTFTFGLPLFTGQADKQFDETFDAGGAASGRAHIVINGEAPKAP